MANYPGTPNNDTVQGTTADDLYTDLGVGTDIVKDPGGKNSIDISSATTGATVDLSPGKTSTLSTGTFTLGSLIIGDNPDGVPNSTTSYLDEVAALKASGYNLKAFGVGTGAALPPLAAIDPNASLFTTTTQL